MGASSDPTGQGLGHVPLDQIGRRGHRAFRSAASRLSWAWIASSMAHLADLGRRHVAEDIPVEMHHAALPSRLWQVLSRALHQAAAGIRNDQPHALEAAIDEVSQKRRCTGLVLLVALADA